MSSSSGQRKFSTMRRQPAVVDTGCSCRRTKLMSLFFSNNKPPHPKPRPNPQPQAPSNRHHPLSSYYPFSPSTTTTTTTTTTISPWTSTTHRSSSSTTSSPPTNTTVTTKKKKRQRKTTLEEKGRVEKESVAVVKESEDPYHDFRESMVSMILEKEIYDWDDLRELLHRFLSLNSPYHHDSILRAFTEICNDIFSTTGAAIPRCNGARRKNRHQNQHEHYNGLSRDTIGYV